VLTPGGLYEREQYGLIMVAPPAVLGDAERHTVGQVLVEHEPVRYELVDFHRGRQTGESRKRSDLNVYYYLDGGASAGDEEGVSDVAASVTKNVTFSRSLYFGRGHSVPVGARVHLIFANRSQMEIVWGVEKEQEVVRQVRVKDDKKAAPFWPLFHDDRFAFGRLCWLADPASASPCRPLASDESLTTLPR